MCTPASPQPIMFKFTPEMVKDMDVVNLQLLNTNLKNFVSANKLKPSSLVIILDSSVYFEKDFPGPNVPPSQEMEDFIDTIPFSASSAKLFRSGTGFKQIVINRDLYESLKKSFEELGFAVSAVVPSFVLGPEDSNREITAETCRLIYHKMDQIMADSFINLVDSGETLHQKEQFIMRKYQLPIIIVSVLLLVAAAVVIPMTLRRPAPRKKSASVVVKSPRLPTPTVTPEDHPATPSAEVLGSLSVRILNASGVPGQAASLSTELRTAGLTDIEIGNETKTVDKTSLILSPKAATEAGGFVTKLVEKIYPVLTTQTDTKAKIDIQVTIGKLSDTTP